MLDLGVMRYYTQRRGDTVDITETNFVRPIAALLKSIVIAGATDRDKVCDGMVSLFEDLPEHMRLYVVDVSIADDATVLLLGDIIVNREDDCGLDGHAKDYIITARKLGFHPVEIAHDLIEQDFRHEFGRKITHDLIMRELKDEYDNVLFAAISFVFAEELEGLS